MNNSMKNTYTAIATALNINFLCVPEFCFVCVISYEDMLDAITIHRARKTTGLPCRDCVYYNKCKINPIFAAAMRRVK